MTTPTVVLIHGLAGSRLDMWPISRRLKRLGYGVKNWSYRSLGNRIETHANRLVGDLAALDKSERGLPFHVVTHSMGGIITRLALANRSFEHLHRIVMLAPPHQGSHVARKLTPFLGWLTPSLNQLSDAPDSFVNRLPNSLAENEVEFGIIEASKDRVIEQGGVILHGLVDYARVDGHHGILTWYRDTVRLVENFLEHGRFSDVNAVPLQREYLGV